MLFEEHESELIEEHDQAEERFYKLGRFVSSKICYTLPKVERDLLMLQYRHMSKYICVLKARLEIVLSNKKVSTFLGPDGVRQSPLDGLLGGEEEVS